MGKEGRTEITGDQETSKVLKVIKNTTGVTRIHRDSQKIREDKGNIEMTDLSKDSEMEVIEVTSRKD